MFWSIGQNIEIKIRKRIDKCLLEMVDIRHKVLEDGTYMVIRGSAIIYISIDAFQMNDKIIRFTAYAVIGATIDADLMAFLLEANSKILFGAFAIDEDQDILFEYALIASNASSYQLKEAVKCVAKAVDDYDDKLTRWGGATSFKVLFGVDAEEATDDQIEQFLTDDSYDLAQ